MVSLHFTEVWKCLTVESMYSTFGHKKFQLCDVAIFCFKGNRQHVERKNRMRNMTYRFMSLRFVWCGEKGSCDHLVT